MILTTERLRLVPVAPDADADALHDVYGDPTVMAWSAGPRSGDVAETGRILADATSLPGARLWTIRPSWCSRACRGGAQVAGPPSATSWGASVCPITLPDGHRITVSGAA